MDSSVRRAGLSGSALKWIAIVTMFIDHLGVTLVWNWYLQSFSPVAIELYSLMRAVGRVAFPIFCFMIVEGYIHTGSKGKYALRLGLFCLIAELPFDLAVWGEIPYSGQNVFFTLLLGLLAIWAGDTLSQRLDWHPVFLTGGAALVLGMTADYLQTDYGFFGVLLIAALYLGRQLRKEADFNTRLLQLLLGTLTILWYCWSHYNWLELMAVGGLGLTLLYNGERGNGPKWFFYWFYPIHLGILGIAVYLLF